MTERKKMKNNRYRRLRAQEMANRNFCAGQTGPEHNPFPPDSMEHRVYAQHMAASINFDDDMAEMYEVYGHADKMPQRRDPRTISVRPPLPGYP